ncbi:MAG TPA: flagellar hook-associated protein FlgL [Rubrivivax sp.]|nr:flagellar hook-associated protein FlgL [Rubrivivax sp.]
MRVTTYNAYRDTIHNLQQRQQDLQQIQEQLTSGKRVAKPSDDPVAAARAERALATMTRADAQQRALEASRTVTQMTESALGDAGELLQTARETLLAAGNASYTDAERQALVLTLKGVREQLLGVANRSDGVGSHLFGGQGSASPPFVEVPNAPDPVTGVADPPTRVEYRGVRGDTRVATEERLGTMIDGEDTWLLAPNGAQPPDPTTVSVFEVLDKAISALSASGASGDDVAAAVKAGVAGVDHSLSHLLSVRARVGEALNRTDRAELRIADTKLAAQTERSNAEDLDLVQAISDFQNQQTGYDAALKAYSMVQKLSLFNYISG